MKVIKMLGTILDNIAFGVHANVPRPIMAYKASKEHDISFQSAYGLTRGSKRYWREQAVIILAYPIWAHLSRELQKRGAQIPEEFILDIPIKILEGITSTNITESMLAGIRRYRRDVWDSIPKSNTFDYAEFDKAYRGKERVTLMPDTPSEVSIIPGEFESVGQPAML